MHSSLEVPPLFCCRFQFPASFSWQSDSLTFVTRILWYKEDVSRSVGAKQTQIITLPLPCLTVWYEVFVLYALYRCYSKYGSRSRGLFRWKHANASCAAMFSLERRGFLLATSKQSILVQCAVQSEPYRVWHAALGFFVVSLSIGVNMSGRPILGKFANCIKCWISILHL